MHCRAVLILDEELKQLEVEPIWGITISRLPNHRLLFFANISGLKDSKWENGAFHVTLFFSEHYNEDAPDVIFNTIPFHPNVDPESGKLYADFLDNSLTRKKEDVVSVANILLSIQEILSNPVLENAVNIEASKLLQTSPHDYEKMVKQCVNESRHLRGVLDSKILENYTTEFNPKSKQAVKTIKASATEPQSVVSHAKAKQVSFDVYHRGWAQVATTKPSPYQDDDTMDEDRETLQLWNPAYTTWRTMSPASAIRVSANRSKSPHLVIPANTAKMDQIRQKKQERITALRKLYMNKPDNDPGLAAPSTSMTELTPQPRTGQSAPEAWESEADELVAWTDTLDEKKV